MENKLNEAISRYFKRLSQVGYASEQDMFSILVLDYITELQESDILTDEEQSLVDKAYLCLQGTCLIPYSSCKGTCTQ